MCSKACARRGCRSNYHLTMPTSGVDAVDGSSTGT
jgi:hypothetical protein